MGTIGRVVTRRSSLRGQTGVNVGRFLGFLLSGTLARFVCHRFFLLVTAGACVLRCRSLRYPCTFCFCADCHYDYLRGFWLQRWVGRLLCFFLNSSFLATSGDAILRCNGAQGARSFRSVRRTPGRALCSRLGCTWLRPPAGTAFWLPGFLLHRCHTKRTASSCTVCCLVRNSVQVCSRTTCSSELPHLLPPCGARCALVPMNLVLA